MGNLNSSQISSRPSSRKRSKLRKTSGISLRTHFGLNCARSNASITILQQTPQTSDEKTVTLVGDSHKSISPVSPPCHSVFQSSTKNEEEAEFSQFLDQYPEYHLASTIDTLRQTDFTRLDHAGETYADYMGGALYPESLVADHAHMLKNSILGNTHSVSNSSKLSLRYADEARDAVLSHFGASAEYAVIFTHNTSGALKLVAESFPFAGGSRLVLGVDSHNSVHGIREYAAIKGALTVYAPYISQDDANITETKSILFNNRPQSTNATAPSLYVLTAQSNITNSKTSLALADYASLHGYYTLVDAAALAATSIVHISDHAIDAMAVSFYKMFGYPTGIGALIVKKSLLVQLNRPWFSGGTVDIVQVPGKIFTRSQVLHEQFEDGTINYVQLPAITNGLRFAATYFPFLPLRLSALLIYLASSLSDLRHDTSGRPVVQILSQLPTRRLHFVGEQGDTGFILSMIFYEPSGQILPNSFIDFAASTQNISLRTGCMCNPGGAAAILGMEDEMKCFYQGVTAADYEKNSGREFGVVRVSLGLASNFSDVRHIIHFASFIGTKQPREALWNQWISMKLDSTKNIE